MKRSFRWLIVIALVCALPLACGKKGGDEATGGGGVAASGGGGGGEAAGSGRLDAATVKKLTETVIDGFTLGQANASGTMGTIFYTATEENAHKKKASIMVSLSPCMGCQKMDRAVWEGNKDNLMSMTLSKAHKSNPDLVFDIREADFDGKKVIYTYELSYVVNKTEHGTSRSTANGIMVFYNNGTNQIVLQVSSRGFGMGGSVEELAASFTEAEMLAAAKKVFAAFVGAL